jgi:hypothetical protein
MRPPKYQTGSSKLHAQPVGHCRHRPSDLRGIQNGKILERARRARPPLASGHARGRGVYSVWVAHLKLASKPDQVVVELLLAPTLSWHFLRRVEHPAAGGEILGVVTLLCHREIVVSLALISLISERFFGGNVD